MFKVRQLSYALGAGLGLLCDIALGAENAAAGPLSVSGLGQWFLSMFGVLAIIFVLAYFLKRSRFVQNKSGEMSVVGQLALGPKERLVQVNLGGRQILVGVGQGAVSYICELSEGEFKADLTAAKSVQDLEALVEKAVDKAVSAKLADLKSDIKDAVAAEIGRNLIAALQSTAPAPAKKVDEVSKAKADYAKKQEQAFDEAVAAMQADTSREEYDLAPVPGAREYTIVDPHAKVEKKAKPYVFKPLPSEAELKRQKEIPYDELLPSQNFRTVNKELMHKLEIETAPKPEDYTDEDGNPIPRPVYSRVPFKRQIIGSGFSGRIFK